MSRTVVVLLGPTSSIGNLVDPVLRREPRTFYGKLRLLDYLGPVDVLANHNHDHVVGCVSRVFKLADWPVGNSRTDWWAAELSLDGADWAKRGTACSIAAWPLGTESDYGEGVEVIHDAIVHEVSLVAPPHRPAEPFARVLSVRNEEPVSIAGDGQLLRRGTGTILGVR